MTESQAEVFRRLSQTSYEVAVAQVHGGDGIDALMKVLGLASQLFEVLPYEHMTDGAAVCVPIGDWDPGELDEIVDLRSLEELNGHHLSGVTVIVGQGAQIYMIPGDKLAQVSGERFVAYRYVHGSTEEVVIDFVAWTLQRGPFPCSRAIPTFDKLEEAVETYIALNRVPEYCPKIQETWRDDKRLAFVAKPEKKLRRSLFLALRQSMGGSAQVREELAQDDTKPVDIEVTWWDGKRSAIIEVKWLGHSGPVGRASFSTSYPASRAVDGLRQLDDYLDRRMGSTPNVSLMGYLFVFDARREGVTPETTTISRDNGMFYKYREPSYPEELLTQTRMGRPFRCFLEPVIG